MHTDVRSEYNVTPLHFACQGGLKETVQYLVEECKCDVGESVCVFVFIHAYIDVM